MLYEGRKDIPLIFKVCDPCAVFKGPKWLAGKFTWPGQDAVQVPGERAIRFISHAYGIHAACVTLLGYQRRGLNTIKTMIEEYAPKFENLTSVYIARVCAKLSVQPTDVVDVTDEKVMGLLIRAIIMVECGPKVPKDLPKNWVEEEEIDKGVRMALGKARKPSAPVKPPLSCTVFPVTPEEERDLAAAGVWLR
ncbi:MAG: hypothetical protein AB7O88_16510 [Reyranellaceae bacterium]|jgi:hypothetical protein